MQDIKPLCNCQYVKSYRDGQYLAQEQDKYGLFIETQHQNQDKFFLPMQDVSYSVSVKNNISTTTLVQVYQNVYDKPISAEYIFPVSQNATFISFTAEYNEKKIQGLIKEKEEAIKEYNQHKKAGNTVALAQTNEKSQEIIKTNLANIQPNSVVKIIFVYTEELEISGNKFWMYSIPSKISPNPCGLTPNSQNTNIQNIHKPCQTHIQVNIESDSKIEFFRSTTHEFQNYQENIDQTHVSAEIKNIQKFTDFVFLYKDSQIEKPSVLIGKNDIQMCAQVNFVPNFNNLNINDAFQQQINDSGSFQVDMNKARGEFIFLLDRSGSMSGSSIKFAKEALIIFLKSLPQNCYFNVYSFGSTYKPLFPKGSSFYSQGTLEYAIDQINKFQADFGGTEIKDLLLDIYSQEKMKNTPRQIFLLTDGEVWQPEQPLNLIKKQSKTTRFHSIGIGSSCSEYLVKQSAINGKGKSIFIKNNQDIAGDIIDLLDYTLTPCLDSFKIKYDKDVVDYMVPNPENMPIITKNQPFTSYIFFKPGVQDLNTQIELEYYDTSVEQNLSYTLNVNTQNCRQDQNVFKMGIHRVIQGLQSHLDCPNRDEQFMKNMKNFKNNKNLSIKDKRIKLLAQKQQPKCQKGHIYEQIEKNNENIKNLICDVCEKNISTLNCISNRCKICDYDICEICYDNQHKLCNLGHPLQFYSLQSKKISRLQCDMCNFAPQQLGVGSYRCETCDFDTCENCNKEEEKLLKQKQYNVKDNIITNLSNKDEENNFELIIQFDDIYFAKIISVKEEIVNLSVQNQILSTQTAFICVIDELDDEKKAKFQQEQQQYIQENNKKNYNNNNQDDLLDCFGGYNQQNQSQQMNSSNQNYLINQSQQYNNSYNFSDDEDCSESMEEELQCSTNKKSNYNQAFDLLDFQEEEKIVKNKCEMQYKNNVQAKKKKEKSSSGLFGLFGRKQKNVQQESLNENQNLQRKRNQQNCDLFSDFSMPMQQQNIINNQQQQQQQQVNFNQGLNNFTQQQQCFQQPQSYCQQNQSSIIYNSSQQLQQERGEIQKQKQQQISKKPLYNDQLLMTIIKDQQFNGSWIFSQQYCQNTLGIELNQLKNYQQDINALGQDLWFTMFLVKFITEKFQNQKSVWQLIIRKANNWISQSSQTKNQNLLQYQQSISNLVSAI